MLHVINETLESLYKNHNCPPDIQQKDAFERKKAIIGQSLYGVEVKRWAVWINQLRLWLTLFIDMPDDMKNSLTPLLPSLNFKIRRGDSIVQRIGGKLFPVHGETDLPKTIRDKIDELKKEKIDFYYNRGKDEKFVHKLETDVFKKIVNEQIKIKQKQLDSIAKPQKQLGLGFGKSETEQKHLLELASYEKKRSELIADIEELKLEYSNLSEEHPLIWSIEFSEIFYDRGGFDIIIGNPPYVRQEDIADPDGNVEPKAYKDLLHQTMRLDYPKYFTDKRKIDGKSDLYTFFYLRGLHLLNENGVHVFICSNSWLDVGYGVWIQEFLLNNVPVRYIIDNHARRSFATSDVNTIISVLDAPLRKGAVPDDHIVKFIAFKKPFEQCIFTEKLLEIEQATDITKNDTFRVYPINNKALYDEGWEADEESKSKEAGEYVGDKWGGKYLRAPDIFFNLIIKKGKYDVMLKKIKTGYGTKTGAVQFFVISDEIIKQYNLEKHYKLFLDSSRGINELQIDHSSLSKVFSYDNEYSKHAKKYIHWGEAEGFHLRESLKHRREWYKIDFIETNYVLLQFFDKRFFTPFSDSPIAISNSFWGITDFGNYDKYVLFCFLNSTFYFLQLELFGRSNMGEGVLTVYGTDFKYIVIPKTLETIKNSNKNLKASVGTIFEECGLNPESEIPLPEQEPNPLPDRKELDDIVFDALDLTQDERKEVYRAVCQLVWNRISKAKSVKKRK
jgi:hypothetical protein